MTTKEMRKLSGLLNKFNKHLDATYVVTAGYETIKNAKRVVKHEIRQKEKEKEL